MVLALLALLIRVFSANEGWVERYYSQGLYPPIARGMRLLLGWVPFSVGDLLYLAAGMGLLLATGRTVRRFLRSPDRRPLVLPALVRLTEGILVVYIVFQLVWGLNYSRQGVAAQLDLDPLPYSMADLGIVGAEVQQRLAELAPLVDTIGREVLHHRDTLTQTGLAAYRQACMQLPFLDYQHPSIKPSLFSSLGHFVGFTGYYNPFSFEAQIKTTIPVFLKPFVVTHEMAHQIGYAKESEANFVAYLTSKQSLNPEVRYAVYFELFLYTLADMRRVDSVAAHNFREVAPPRVKRDLQLLYAYLERSRNPVEPYMAWLYDQYLRRNNQPKGRQSYNEVLVWLVAYGKKFGRKSL